MFLPRLFARPQRPAPRLRSSLRLEELDLRAVPDGNDPPLSPPPPPGGDPAQVGQPPQTTAPVISNFVAREVSFGWYEFEGYVTADNNVGMTVYFAGVPAVTDETAHTDVNGYFCLLVQVHTDGSDAGTVTAQTVDSHGNWSNVAMTVISPTQ
jgi:hypothetical protein